MHNQLSRILPAHLPIRDRSDEAPCTTNVTLPTGRDSSGSTTVTLSRSLSDCGISYSHKHGQPLGTAVHGTYICREGGLADAHCSILRLNHDTHTLRMRSRECVRDLRAHSADIESCECKHNQCQITALLVQVVLDCSGGACRGRSDEKTLE